MLKGILRLLRATWFMALLMLFFAIALATGTLIEHNYNTATARILIYNVWWFEGLMLLMILSFLLNIKRYNLFQVNKWPTLLLHISLIVIIIGAFITRYNGVEGLMSIREGESSDLILTEKTYLQVIAESHQGETIFRKTIEHPVLLSQTTPRANSFHIRETFLGDKLEVVFKKFIENAISSFTPENNGELHIKIVIAGSSERTTHYVSSGEVVKLGNNLFAFNQPTPNAINFTTKDSYVIIKVPNKGTVHNMANQTRKSFATSTLDTLQYKSLYEINSTAFVIPEPPKRGNKKILSQGSKRNKITSDALSIELNTKVGKHLITVHGNKQALGDPYITVIDGITYKVSYGSKSHKLPFKIKLNDFIAQKYPGTLNSYKSFKSKVEVIDSDKTNDEEIYMNHVLDYQGYRFFQASFHPDEKGTILSVNKDVIGTWTTYTGYFMLYLGLIWILFSKNSRFYQVSKKLRKLNRRKTLHVLWLIGVLSLSGQVISQEIPSPHLVKDQIDSIVNLYNVPDSHAQKFGSLVIQDENGRMKPINTFSSELLRKLSKRTTYQKLSPDQVLISIMQYPELWYNVPLIFLKKGNDSIRNILNIPKESHHAALASFFNIDGSYKLDNQVKEAYQSINPDQFAKDFMETDKRVNLLYETLRGQTLKLFPIPEDSNNTWISVNEVEDRMQTFRDTVFIKNILPFYYQTLSEARASKDYTEADLILKKIKAFQIKHGNKVRPKESNITAEILYNKVDLLNRLFIWYFSSGLLLLIAAILSLLYRNKVIISSLLFIRLLIIICFILHTCGLIFRAYVSGHAPWSDAYETMIYIGWATMLFGMMYCFRSFLALGATAFIVSIILMVAHWNWLDPSIANLQPVLDSYWLMIHVAIIVASYGPFTLAMILGILSMLLMLFLNNENQNRLKSQITSLTLTTELTVTIGLVMLTIGNFLGGQWANESWGRYWAWDPKETWALVSIVLYAFIIHMRLVPILRGQWMFAMMSVLGFYSIFMTYFGVNFYLSGLHSYAKGDLLFTPSIIAYSMITILLLGTFSYIRQRAYL